MIRIFRHYVPRSLALLGVAEAVFLFFAIEIAVRYRLYEIESSAEPLWQRVPENLTFVAVVYVTMLAVGLYQQECARDLRLSVSRLVAALVFAFMALGIIFYFFPGLVIWRSMTVYALLLAFLGIVAIRAAFAKFVDPEALRRRVLVLGAGDRAALLEALERDQGDHAGFTIVAFVAMRSDETRIKTARPRASLNSLSEIIDAEAVSEVVLAMDERRGGLPIDDLLEARLRGTDVTDLAHFLERENGRVNLDTLRPSDIIFSDDFRLGNRLSRVIKRIFDMATSLALLLFSFPILILTALVVKFDSPGPVFYRQERVGQFGRRFAVLKFRSMRTDAEGDGKPRWAGDNDPRVTRVGRFIRSTRIDEIPQIFNVLRGDMSFVGPRPERPYFVEELAKAIPYFAERHSVKPGITGWAQLNYPYGASVEDARHKLEYDLYYVKNYTIFLDLLILIQTVRVVLWPDGVR